MVYYLTKVHEGLVLVSSCGDGYTINLRWSRAYPSVNSNEIAYHIYMSTEEDNVFSEGVKFISIDGSIEVDIYDLTPGQLYHFAVRAVEYDTNIVDPSQLPETFNGLKVYPQSLLSSNITETDEIIPFVDVETFPPTGIIKVGGELINYLSVDTVNSELVLTNYALQRGFLNSIAASHDTDGYDGYNYYSPFASFILGREEMNTKIFPCQSRFEQGTYAFTIPDGYHQVLKDLFTSDMDSTETSNSDFPSYDYSGYHRTDPTLLLSGDCVGSYIGGEYGCIDGYGNVNMLRGMSLQDQNTQRQEQLLSLIGRKAVLIKRQRSGITCDCYLPSSEFADDRCPKCHGTKFVIGYSQYFYPKSSDGRIMVRVNPADEDIKVYEGGWESEMMLDAWTLVIPIIKDRDVIVLFDQEDNEEYRYEVLNVGRNNTILGEFGGQKLRLQRVRKTDPIYQVRIFRNTAMFPVQLQTSIGSTTNIPNHSHSIVVSEKITALYQINQTTGIAFGHTHQIVAGIVQPVLGHSHDIIL
jgi:hypothetical protein